MEQNTTQIIALSILILLDMVSGIAVSAQRGQLSSSIGRKGLAKKGLELLLLLAFTYLPKLDSASFPPQIFTLLYSGFVFFECVSIIENASILGLDVSALSRFLKAPEDKKETSEEKAPEEEKETSEDVKK